MSKGKIVRQSIKRWLIEFAEYGKTAYRKAGRQKTKYRTGKIEKAKYRSGKMSKANYGSGKDSKQATNMQKVRLCRA